MTLALTPRNRLAAPLAAVPIEPSQPPIEPPVEASAGTVLEEPHDAARIPGYLAIARAHAQRHKGSLTALARLAQAELSAGNTAAAAAVAGQALAFEPEHSDAVATLAAAEVLRASGNSAVARERVAHLSVGGEFVHILRARLAIDGGDLEAARVLLENAESFDGLVLGAWLDIREENYAHGIGLLRRAARRSGATPAVLINLGYAHACLGHLNHAIQETRQAQILAPHNRIAAFNLVCFHMAKGDFPGAITALSPLERIAPTDVALAITKAHVILRAGDRQGAHRILQQARTSTAWASAPLIRRAELDANLGWLRWLTDQRNAQWTRKVLLEQLEISEYKSLGIALLLPSLMSNTKDHRDFSSIVEKVSAHHNEEAMLPLRLSDAVLSRDADRAVQLAVEWVSHDRLNPQAAAIAVLLLDAFSDRREDAIALGTDALRRAPGDPLLANNVAYSLAWDGQLAKARATLDRVRMPTPPVAVLATYALIDLLSGNADRGIEGYHSARREAESRKEGNLAQLVDLNLAFALRYLDKQNAADRDRHAQSEFEVPSELMDTTNAWLLTSRAKRLGL